MFQFDDVMMPLGNKKDIRLSAMVIRHIVRAATRKLYTRRIEQLYYIYIYT